MYFLYSLATCQNVAWYLLFVYAHCQKNLGICIRLEIVHIISRVIALPSVKYSGRVETDVFNCDLGGARRDTSQPVAKITIDPEQCMAMLLEKLRKSDWSLRDCCLCLQHMFKDQPWMLWVSGETRSAARNSQAYRLNVLSVKSAYISTYTEAT